MSRSPSEAWPRSMGSSLGRAWRRARGRVPRHTLYLQPHGVQSWRHGARTDPRTGADNNAKASAAAFTSFDAWCAANAGADVQAYVSGHLLHSLVVDPSLALDGDVAVQSYARQQFAHYHGPQARHWPLAAWCDDSGAGACALHALDMNALLATAAQHDVRLRSVAPAWSAGLNSLAQFWPSFATPGLRALALVEGTLLTWLVADAGRIVALQQRFIDAPHTHALAELLTGLVDEATPLAEPPLVIGWGLSDGATTALPHCQLLGTLDDRGATTRWMLDAIGAVA